VCLTEITESAEELALADVELVSSEPSVNAAGVELLQGSPELEGVVEGRLGLDEHLATGIRVGERSLLLLLARRSGSLSCLLLGLLRLLLRLLALGLLLGC